ncbi:patatin-like phospholipase family protein [Dyadobacter sediminis]|uniref:Patatin-like phospholipase family protein n=1 Tax=Dyadobacter sediminis TaxID=1493691 RepID=A0A5R9KK93_9BACT|nr:patatin-like phospholipase family protein [Dyadobacter sediminis]TLU96648.1 patatin-like phospholipase family protein [Dyadobacter sediminis]GGB84016.1 hypothetical protein GCM10011325_09490 [Dyadobacter sediminis]
MENSSRQDSERTHNPFDNIALALSGGGFRAASFSLGVLSYLDTLKLENGSTLLSRVTYISSASGGTMAGAMYALNNAQGLPFGTFYKSLFENLEGTGLLDKVFGILNDDKQWELRPNKQRNIINAFALAYDSALFDAALLGDLYQSGSPAHIQEICFNATEFYKGLLFRQNIKMQPDPLYRSDEQFRFGNRNISLSYRSAKRLKLSDLLAASSCFPAGFEPVVFPDDFTYNAYSSHVKTALPELNKRELLNGLFVQLKEYDKTELERLYGKPGAEQIIASLPPDPKPEDIIRLANQFAVVDDFKMGMMDGGITDNQALESILDAQERRKSGKTIFKPFDLMLINDVGSDFIDPYIPNAKKDTYTGIKGITIHSIITLLLIAGLLSAALTVSGFLYIQQINRAKIAIVAETACLLVSAIALAALLLIRSYIKGNIHLIGGLNLDKNFSKTIVTNLFSHFGATPLMVIIRMFQERISSVLLLNNDVFLKRIRYLLYHNAYESKKYIYRLKTNHIYDLSFSNDHVRQNIPSLKPGRALQIVAQAAFETGTTLWFDTSSQQSGKLPALIACGQFTTCYNLLEYIYRMKSIRKNKPSYFSSLSAAEQEKINALEKALKADYARFNSDPFWLYNQKGTQFGIAGFKPCDVSGFPFPAVFEGLR